VEERPATMRLLSTHDTKRSADVRARLAVLSQDPGRWVRAAWRLQALAAPHRSAAGPTPAHEHLAWQTAVGAWPIDAERLGDYLVKAAREGKEATTWLAPDTGYEEALRRYAQALTGDPALVAAIDAIVAEVAAAGRATSLAMVLVTACGPGVPDVYQGDETWSHTLVDPDNRRDVDHAALAAVTAAVQPPAIPERAAEVWQQAATGAVKTWVWRRVLEVRASRPASFGPGAAYRACWARGPRSAHVLGFRRGDDVLAVVGPPGARRRAHTPPRGGGGAPPPGGAGGRRGERRTCGAAGGVTTAAGSARPGARCSAPHRPTGRGRAPRSRCPRGPGGT
ncbi:MAG: hypothetical protein JJT89_17865, partial [Nitriliruptoraceae bacterium]|nr:hypothetical protein [Nitriliruptoraceae bacterium]